MRYACVAVRIVRRCLHGAFYRAMAVTFLYASSAFAFAFASLALAADNFAVTDIKTSVKEEYISFHSQLNLSLSDEVANALQHGIALHLSIDVELYRVRKYFLDKKIKKWQVRPELSYHNLSNQYYARITPQHAPENFLTLTETLDYVARGAPLQLSLDNPLDMTTRTYKLKVKVRIAKDQLPAPLRLWSYVAPSWRINSGWSIWILRS